MVLFRSKTKDGFLLAILQDDKKNKNMDIVDEMGRGWYKKRDDDGFCSISCFLLKAPAQSFSPCAFKRQFWANEMVGC